MKCVGKSDIENTGESIVTEWEKIHGSTEMGDINQNSFQGKKNSEFYPMTPVDSVMWEQSDVYVRLRDRDTVLGEDHEFVKTSQHFSFPFKQHFAVLTKKKGKKSFFGLI